MSFFMIKLQLYDCILISVPPVFRSKFFKIPQKYFMNSAPDLSKFRGNSAEIILSFYINYK